MATRQALEDVETAYPQTPHANRGAVHLRSFQTHGFRALGGVKEVRMKREWAAAQDSKSS